MPYKIDNIYHYPIVIPDATPTSDGVMTAAQAAQLAGGAGVVVPTIFRAMGPIPNGATPATVAPQTYMYPLYIPPGATTARLLIANRSGFNADDAGYTPIPADLAVYTSDGAGGGVGAPLMQTLGITIPADGTKLVSPAFNVVRGADGKLLIVVAYTGVLGMQIAYMAGLANWGTLNLGVQSVNPLPAPTGNNNAIFSIALDYDPPSGPRIGLVGDSISVGYSGGAIPCGYENSALYLVMQSLNWPTIHAGLPGGALADFSNQGFPFLWDDQRYQGTNVVLQIGVNSLPVGSRQMMNQYEVLAGLCRAKGAKRILGRTISPLNAVGLPETDRQIINNWIRTVPGIFDDFVDADAILRNPLAPSTLLPAFDCGDGLHLTPAGQQAEANAWIALFSALTNP